MPPNTVSVTRPGRYGNPFTNVEDYRLWITGHLHSAMAGIAPSIESIQSDLGGKNLACFCKLSAPCHADILLEIANR